MHGPPPSRGVTVLVGAEGPRQNTQNTRFEPMFQPQGLAPIQDRIPDIRRISKSCVKFREAGRNSCAQVLRRDRHHGCRLPTAGGVRQVGVGQRRLRDDGIDKCRIELYAESG